jgi:hypothetical protein
VQATCQTCAHWRDEEDDYLLHPLDPDTYERMVFSFDVRRCTHPELLFCERPLDPRGFAVADGSEYMANLYTAESFGCVRHETEA